jgi:hypothetical protein
MNIKGLLEAAVKVAETAGPLLGPAGVAGAAAAGAIRDLVNRTEVIAAETGETELQDRLAKALLDMNAHADRTLDSLG